MNESVPVNDLSASQKCISNTTIAVLIILALVITIIGTLAVLDSTSSSRVAHGSSTNVGKVSLQILPADTPPNELVVPTRSN